MGEHQDCGVSCYGHVQAPPSRSHAVLLLLTSPAPSSRHQVLSMSPLLPRSPPKPPQGSQGPSVCPPLPPTTPDFVPSRGPELTLWANGLCGPPCWVEMDSLLPSSLSPWASRAHSLLPSSETDSGSRGQWREAGASQAGRGSERLGGYTGNTGGPGASARLSSGSSNERSLSPPPSSSPSRCRSSPGRSCGPR